MNKRLSLKALKYFAEGGRKEDKKKIMDMLKNIKDEDIKDTIADGVLNKGSLSEAVDEVQSYGGETGIPLLDSGKAPSKPKNPTLAKHEANLDELSGMHRAKVKMESDAKLRQGIKDVDARRKELGRLKAEASTGRRLPRSEEAMDYLKRVDENPTIPSKSDLELPEELPPRKISMKEQLTDKLEDAKMKAKRALEGGPKVRKSIRPGQVQGKLPSAKDLEMPDISLEDKIKELAKKANYKAGKVTKPLMKGGQKLLKHAGPIGTALSMAPAAYENIKEKGLTKEALGQTVQDTFLEEMFPSVQADENEFVKIYSKLKDLKKQDPEKYEKALQMYRDKYSNPGREYADGSYDEDAEYEEFLKDRASQNKKYKDMADDRSSVAKSSILSRIKESIGMPDIDDPRKRTLENIQRIREARDYADGSSGMIRKLDEHRNRIAQEEMARKIAASNLDSNTEKDLGYVLSGGEDSLVGALKTPVRAYEALKNKLK